MDSEAQRDQSVLKLNVDLSGPPANNFQAVGDKSDAPAAAATIATKAFEPPPNGGTLAWLQVLGGACLWMATM